jgi:hypothetical protein
MMLADTIETQLRRRSSTSWVCAFTRSCTVTRPRVSTSSTGIPATVSVSAASDRILDLEQKLRRIADHVLQHQVHVHDVGVARQELRAGRHLAISGRQDKPDTDFHDAGRLDDVDLVNRPWHPILHPGSDLFGDGAEPAHHPALIRPDHVEARGKARAEQDQDGGCKPGSRAPLRRLGNELLPAFAGAGGSPMRSRSPANVICALPRTSSSQAVGVGRRESAALVRRAEGADRSGRAWRRLAGGRLRLKTQRAQNLGMRGQKQHRFVVQDLVVRLQCPQELVEVCVLPEPRGVGAGSLRIAFRLIARGRACGFGLDAGPLVLGLGGDLAGRAGCSARASTASMPRPRPRCPRRGSPAKRPQRSLTAPARKPPGQSSSRSRKPQRTMRFTVPTMAWLGPPAVGARGTSA